MKGIATVLLGFLLITVPSAQAQFTFTTNNGTITITGYTGSGGAVNIPGETNGLPVTSIAGYAISDLFSTPLTVTIPGSVNDVGDYAFQFDYNLSSVFFEGNAPNIGSHVFFSDTLFGGAETAYYLAGTTGWGSTVGAAIPTKQLTVIAISQSRTNGVMPLMVDFTAAAIDSANNTVSNWNWSFGDGSTSATQNPSHTYTTIGTFSVTVIETNNNGLPLAGAATSVTVSPFTIAFTADPISGVAPLTVNFTSASVDNVGNAITSWTWNFGDGSGSAVQNPSHTFTSAGTFSPGLLATNFAGNTVFGSGPGSILVMPPPQDLFSFTTNNGAITITGYLGGGGAVNIPSSIYGLPVTSIAGLAIANLFYVPMTVTIPGSVTSIGNYAFQNDYDLTQVYFEGNAPAAGPYVFLGGTETAYYLSGSAGWGSTIGASIPTRELTGIAITANPTNGLEPLAVSFTAAGIDSTGNAVTNWNWDFGDGSTSTAQNPSHSYTAGGGFAVTLIENDSNGAPMAGAMTPVTVTPLTVAFSANPSNGLAPLAVSFTAAGLDTGGHTITNWSWDFGDGSTGNTTTPNASHTYTNSGTFSATLTATDNLGLVVAGTGPAITVAPLMVAFDANPASGLVPLVVSFTSANVDNGGHDITNWNWDFGDGSTSATQNPSHIYTNASVYPIALFATNNLGLTVIGSGLAEVSVLLPVPNYTGFKVLHSFAGRDGAHPYAGLIQYGNLLYGTTEASVSPPNGTLFRLNNATLAFADLIHFPVFNPPGNQNYDGANPSARLFRSGRTLYGTASLGGRAGFGNVFSVDPGTLKLLSLHPFSSATHQGNSQIWINSDGIYPAAAVVQVGETLYGTTHDGGSLGYGTVFGFNLANSNFTTLHAFTGGNDGAFPVGDLIASGNTLFGTANKGGTNGHGTVFSLNVSDSSFTSLYSFSGGADGAYPSTGGLLLSSNTLYGAANQGGNAYGTIFSLNTNGSNFNRLYGFTGVADGAYPGASLILLGETLYGTASGAGANGSGTIFSLDLSAKSPGVTTLYSFTSTNIALGPNLDGANPQPGLVLSENVLYGTARNGGTNGYGTLFAFPLPSTAPGVDLTKAADSINSLSPHAGDTVTVSLTITNQSCSFGSTNAGAFHVGLYGLASTSAGLNTLTPFYEQAVSGCGANSSVSFNLDIVISPSQSPGTAYLGYKINDEHEVAECNENNNGILFWTLNVLAPSPPPKVITPSPANGALGQPITTILSWANDARATSYEVYFNGQFMTNQTLTSFQPATLAYHTAYSWRVDATGAGGTTTGDTWSFTTLAPAIGAAPFGNSVILSWPTNAPGFVLEYATNLPPIIWSTSSFAPTIVNGQFTITNTNTTPGIATFYRLLR